VVGTERDAIVGFGPRHVTAIASTLSFENGCFVHGSVDRAQIDGKKLPFFGQLGRVTKRGIVMK
jgi:hypothetical protein